MDHNNWTLGNCVPTVNHFFRSQDNRFSVERFSSPTPEPGPSGTSHIHADFWNDTGEYMRLTRLISYYMLPQTCLRLRQYSRERVMLTLRYRRRDITVTDMVAVRHDFSAFSLDHSDIPHRMRSMVSSCSVFTYVPCLRPFYPTEHSSYNTRWDRSEMSGLHHPIDSDQRSSRLPRSTPDEHIPECHVASRSENTTRNEFGWRLRPVSELRALTRVYCSFLINCRSQLTGSAGYSNSGYSMRYNQHVLTRFESVYMRRDRILPLFVGPTFGGKSGSYTPT